MGNLKILRSWSDYFMSFVLSLSDLLHTTNCGHVSTLTLRHNFFTLFKNHPSKPIRLHNCEPSRSTGFFSSANIPMILYIKRQRLCLKRNEHRIIFHIQHFYLSCILGDNVFGHKNNERTTEFGLFLYSGYQFYGHGCN